jgi:hypothetical protein
MPLALGLSHPTMSPFAVVVLAASLSLTFAKSVVTVARPGLCVVEASSSASALERRSLNEMFRQYLNQIWSTHG